MKGTMKQVVLSASEQFQVRDVEIPALEQGQALIRVRAVGICGSDIHTYYGKHPFVHAPIVLGHEACGEIVELSDEQTDLRVGDRVVIRPQRTCGACRNCRLGRYNECKYLNVLGCLSTGASSEYFAVETQILYKIPDFLSYAEGTALEPLAVGVHAVKRAGSVEGKNVLVLGAGTIGNMTAQAALGLGAKKVMITDISAFKLGLARSCGIELCVNVAEESLEEAIEREFPDESLDLIMECTANEGVFAQAIDLAPKGIDIVIVGVFEDKPRVDMAGVQDREYRLIGALMYTDEDYRDAIRLAGDREVHLDRVITDTFPLVESASAYKHIEANRHTTQKVILSLD